MSQGQKRPIWQELAMAAALVGLVVVARGTLDVPNFKPVMAVSLIAGLLFCRTAIAVLVPLVAMLVSDQFLGMYQWQMMLVVYLALMVPVLPGMLLRRRSARMSRLRLGGWSLVWTTLSALFFFVATNLAVWTCTPWYEPTLGGLLNCFLMAIPFLKWTWLGNIAFTTLLLMPLLACHTPVPNRTFGILTRPANPAWCPESAFRK